ncbi:MAG: transglutaminase-like domain-containing protein [Hespellia sp.]|nr:transglutaminase-like domain-containing protein [Hespellia sp.]
MLQRRQPKPGFRKRSTGLLLMTQVLLVWLVLCAWWEAQQSYLILKADKAWLYGTLLALTLALWLILESRKKFFFLILGMGAVFIGIWNNIKLFASAVNHVVNAILLQFYHSADQVSFYEEWTGSGKEYGIVLAIILIPIVLLLLVVIRSGKGVFLSVLFLAVPFILAGVVTDFPQVKESLFLLVTGGIYCSAAGCDRGNRAVQRIVVSACLFTLVFMVAAVATNGVEQLKKNHMSAYRSVRKQADTRIASYLRAWTVDQKKDEKKPQQKEEPLDKNREDLLKTENTTAESMDGQDAADQSAQSAGVLESGSVTLPWLTGGTSTGQMSELKNLSSFSPEEGTSELVTVPEKPTATLYYARTYGGAYKGEGWEEESGERGPEKPNTEAPSTLTRLRTLCGEHPVQSLAEAEQFIRREFEENTIYSYQPGSTPKNQDFAEYFLFENKKGFCVHFATTAVLLYRIYGYPARYVEGYAVPADAFTEQPDGTYQAEITGAMGHAWCEVYEDGWKIREHTLAYSGPKEEVSHSPAVSRGKARERGMLAVRVLLILGVLALGVLLFFLQAGIRRKRRDLACRKNSRAGIENIYYGLYRLARLSGMEKCDPLSCEGFGEMQKHLEGMTVEEWEWMYGMVMESMFHNIALEREPCRKMYRIYKHAVRVNCAGMSEWKLIKCKYIDCLV